MTDPDNPGQIPRDRVPTAPPSSPPPPPSTLTAPPGAVNYNTGAYGSGQLSRVLGLGKATTALMVLIAAMVVVNMIFEARLRPDAEAFLEGTISESQFVARLGAFGLFAILIGVVQIAAVAVTIVWLYRVAKNNERLGRGGTWGPGFAIGGWAAPPLVFVIPTLTIDQQWKANSPGTTTDSWQRSAGSPLVIGWGVAFTLSALIPVLARVSGDQLDGNLDQFRRAAETLANPRVSGYVASVMSITAALLFAAIARQLSARHAQMTGEAAA